MAPAPSRMPGGAVAHRDGRSCAVVRAKADQFRLGCPQVALDRYGIAWTFGALAFGGIRPRLCFVGSRMCWATGRDLWVV